jgi:glucoamylase
MVAAACGFLIREGPATAQERWEEAAGYSPSTLAVNIAALICAADLLDGAGDSRTARFVREYADFLESHVDAWTVTTQGSLLAGVARHYIRINPNEGGKEDPDTGTLVLANQPPDGPYEFPARDLVDGGFLELVRYGVRDPHDPIVLDSLRVVDAVLKVETPAGPCWRRYNHDGYGQRADGTSFRADGTSHRGWGTGRLWPLLTGERGHYELAAGNDATPYLKALEGFAVGIGLMPEQVWDQDAIPGKLLRFGGPTGAAIPLVWAHAEYIKLVRSIADRQVFDSIEPVRARYARRNSRASQPLEIWTGKRPIGTIPSGCLLRVIAAGPFTLGWTSNEWHDRRDTPAISTTLDLWYVDLDTRGVKSLRFTFIRRDGEPPDDREYVVQVDTNGARP